MLLLTQPSAITGLGTSTFFCFVSLVVFFCCCCFAFFLISLVNCGFLQTITFGASVKALYGPLLTQAYIRP